MGNVSAHDDLVLRPAMAADVPSLLDLIRGIAEYERLSQEVEATEDLLATHGFGPGRVFEAVLAERGSRAVAFALYFFTFSTFKARPTLYLEDLFMRANRANVDAVWHVIASDPC